MTHPWRLALLLAVAFVCIAPGPAAADGDCAGVEEGGVYVDPPKCVPGGGEQPKPNEPPPP